MSETKSSGTTAVTPMFRVSYPNVFRARKNDLSGKDEYSLVALFKPGEDLSKLKDVVKAAIEKKWGTDPKKWPKKNGVNSIRLPFRDQGEREKESDDGTKFMPDGYTKGAIFLTLKCYEKPRILKGSKENRQVITDESEFYAGCWAYASVNASAYDTKGNCGVSLWLNSLLKAKDDGPFSGRRKAEEDFAAIEVADVEASSGGAATTDDIFGA